MTICAFSLLFGAQDLFAQSKKSAKKNTPIKNGALYVKFSPCQTPALSFQNGSQQGTIRSNWWQIECWFETNKEQDKERNEKVLDEVTFKFDVAIQDGLYQEKKAPLYFSGAETYSCVKLDGKKHYVVAYVHPMWLEQYAPTPLKDKNPKGVMILVQMVDKDNNVLAVGADASNDMKLKYKLGNPVDPKLTLKEMNKIATNLGVFKKENIIQRRGTPFELLNFDYYEYLKPLEAK